MMLAQLALKVDIAYCNVIRKHLLFTIQFH